MLNNTTYSLPTPILPISFPQKRSRAYYVTRYLKKKKLLKKGFFKKNNSLLFWSSIMFSLASVFFLLHAGPESWTWLVRAEAELSSFLEAVVGRCRRRRLGPVQGFILNCGGSTRLNRREQISLRGVGVWASWDAENLVGRKWSKCQRWYLLRGRGRIAVDFWTKKMYFGGFCAVSIFPTRVLAGWAGRLRSGAGFLACFLRLREKLGLVWGGEGSI